MPTRPSTVQPLWAFSEAAQIDAVALWLKALHRASSELVNAYLVVAQPLVGPDLACFIHADLCGAMRGQLRCRVDAPLALAMAEGMWGEPAASLDEAQVRDAVRALCGQIMGYAAGEVSVLFPGASFHSPCLDRNDAVMPSGDCHVIFSTQVGNLCWEVNLSDSPIHALPPQVLFVRERIRALRETDLQLLQAVRILGIDDTAEDAFERLVTVVGSDPALAARILRRVNSALVRPRGTQIHTLPQALLFLGTRSAKNLVVSALLAEPKRAVHPHRCAIVAHSLNVALLARLLAEACHLDDEECYLLGLLHDIGRLVLDRLGGGEEMPLVEDEALLERERQRFGISHTEAGAILAGSFRFPESVRLVMNLHHDGLLLDHMNLPPSLDRHIHLVAQADRLVERWDEPDELPTLLLETARKLGIEKDVVAACLERTRAQEQEDSDDEAH